MTLFSSTPASITTYSHQSSISRLPTTTYDNLEIILRSELRQKHWNLRSTSNSLKTATDQLHNTVSWIDSIYLKSFIAKHTRQYKKKVNFTHKNKLERLGLKDRILNNDVIFNFSSKHLTSTESNALSFGLQRALPPRKLDYCDHFLSFEKLFTSTHSSITQPNPHFHRQLRNLAHSSFYSFKPRYSTNGLTKDETDALKALSNDKTIRILRADKVTLLLS